PAKAKTFLLTVSAVDNPVSQWADVADAFDRLEKTQEADEAWEKVLQLIPRIKEPRKRLALSTELAVRLWLASRLDLAHVLMRIAENTLLTLSWKEVSSKKGGPIYPYYEGQVAIAEAWAKMQELKRAQKAIKGITVVSIKDEALREIVRQMAAGVASKRV